MCDESTGWFANSTNAAQCVCGGPEHTAVGDECIFNGACLLDPTLLCATCSRTDPRKW